MFPQRRETVHNRLLISLNSEILIGTASEFLPMTICVSVLCKNNQAVVVGTDRMITDRGIPIEFEASESKYSMYKNEDIGIVFASAGSALSPSSFHGVLERNIGEIESIEEAVDLVKRTYIKTKQKKFEESVLSPRGISLEQFYNEGMHNSGRGEEWDRMYNKFSLDLDIILAAKGNQKAYSYRVSDSGEFSGLVESFAGLGFDAVGTGASLARDTLTSRYSTDLSVKQALYVLYTALENASQAPGVGREFDIAVIDDSLMSVNEETKVSLQTIYNENEKSNPYPEDIEERLEGIL